MTLQHPAPARGAVKRERMTRATFRCAPCDVAWQLVVRSKGSPPLGAGSEEYACTGALAAYNVCPLCSEPGWAVAEPHWRPAKRKRVRVRCEDLADTKLGRWALAPQKVP